MHNLLIPHERKNVHYEFFERNKNETYTFDWSGSNSLCTRDTGCAG